VNVASILTGEKRVIPKGVMQIVRSQHAAGAHHAGHGPSRADAVAVIVPRDEELDENPTPLLSLGANFKVRCWHF
jgi:hypothetical protein